MTVDPITYEIIRHRLWSLNEEHGITIARISGSPIVALAHDFNPCLHAADGELIFSGPYIQALNAGAPNAIRWIIDEYGPDFIRPEDMFLTNDPWVGVSHQIDVSILAPVHVNGELIGWVSNAVHQYDVGGPVPGSFIPYAREIFEESAPIPPIRIVEEGTLRPDLERMYLRRSRLPDLLALDLRAGIAGCNVAKASFQAAVEEFGLAVVGTVMQQIVDMSELAFAQRLSAIPDGTWRQEYFLEPHQVDQQTLRLTLTLRKRGERLVFSNEGDPDQGAGQAMTAVGWQGSVTAATASTLCFDQLFALGGALRRIDFELEEGSVGAASFPAAMSCANMRIAQVTSAASQVIAKMLACSEGTLSHSIGAGGDAGMPVLLISGSDERGRPYGTALTDHIAAAIAPSPLRDGVDTGGIAWDPRAAIPNVEDQELLFPILYLYRREAVDSGGAGRTRGGNGGEFAIVPLNVDRIDLATITSAAATVIPAAPGLFGGLPGSTTRYLLVRDSGALARLAASEIPVQLEELEGTREVIPGRSAGVAQYADDVVEERWCGTGGYGDPLLRDAALVAADVQAGKISLAAAEHLYGVVLLGGMAVDEGTSERRQEIRQRRLAESDEPLTTSDGAEATGEELRIAGLIGVVRTDAGAFGFTCVECGRLLCSTDHDYRDGCRTRELPLRSLSPLMQREADQLSGDVVAFESYCPTCATLLACDVVLAGQRPVRDVELVLV
jgi:N-methylhydantoinase B